MKSAFKSTCKDISREELFRGCVYDGEDALSYLEAGCYDAAVPDIMMPKMNVITVLKKFRAAGDQIPVLMLTAKSEIEDRMQGLDSGTNNYLPKPFDTRELLARIRSITRKKPILQRTALQTQARTVHPSFLGNKDSRRC